MKRDWQACRNHRVAVLACAGSTVVLAASGCGSGATQPTTATAGTLVSGDITIDGTVRTYQVLDPGPNDQRPEPLVLVLHGGKEDSTAMITRTNFDQIAAADGFVAVFPDGVQGHWNSGSCCGATVVSVSDEDAFFTQLLDRLESQHHVDRSRVYVTGFSAGG